jgi:hypothetical protein
MRDSNENAKPQSTGRRTNRFTGNYLDIDKQIKRFVLFQDFC